jgi:hypothetical protein
VDFHSFRRAFNTALAEAGVNVQHAMHLAAHSDPKVHARYIMGTAAMRAIPDAALPRLPLGPLLQGSEPPGNVTGRDDSTRASGQDPLFLRAGEGIRTLDVHLGKTKICRDRSFQPVSRSNEFRRLALRGVA